jgi:hypothetical protein
MATTDFIDCQMIIRAFEHGAAYSTDERSVFALMTPFLQDTIVMSMATGRMVKSATKGRLKAIDADISKTLNDMKFRAVIQQVMYAPTKALAEQNASSVVAPPAPMPDIAQLVQDMSGNSQTDEGSVAEVMSGLDPSNAVKAKMADFIKDCIPCLERPNFEELANPFSLDMLESIANQLMDMQQQYWKAVVQKFIDLINMFKNWDQYIDICAFIKWLTEYVCVPDLYKILAALSALLMDINGLLDGFGIDLVLGLVAPLLMPILEALITLLMQFIDMVLKPLECIIASITSIMRKLDISSFQLPLTTTVRVPSFGAKARARDQAAANAYRNDSVSSEDEDNYSAAQNAASVTKAEAQEAYARETGRALDASKSRTEEQGFYEDRLADEASISDEDTDAYAAANPAREYTTDESDPSWNKTWKNPDISKTDAMKKMRAATAKVAEMGQNIQSMFNDMIKFIRMAIDKFKQTLYQVLDELKKLIEEYILGFSVSAGRAAAQKLGILRLISIVAFFVKLFMSTPDCKEGKTPADLLKSFVQNVLNDAKDRLVYIDPLGNVHIEEPDSATQKARDLLGGLLRNPNFDGPVNQLAGGIARDVVVTTSPTKGDTTTGVDTGIGGGAGNGAGNGAGGQAYSVISVGDPELDAGIAGIVEKLLTPAKVVYGCPSNITVSDVARYSQWISGK